MKNEVATDRDINPLKNEYHVPFQDLNYFICKKEELHYDLQESIIIWNFVVYHVTVFCLSNIAFCQTTLIVLERAHQLYVSSLM